MADALKDMSDSLIVDTLLIPSACRERFLPVQEECAWPLRERGIVAAGVSDLTAPFTVGRAAPSVHVVLGTIAGEAHFVTPTAEGRMTPGELWVGPAACPYRYEVRGKPGAGGEWRVLWFHLAPGPRWSALAGQTVFQRKMHTMAAMLAALEGFVAETVRRESGSEAAARAYAEIIGVLLDRELEVMPSRRTAHGLAALWEAVNADPAAPWTGAAAAERLGVSPAQVHRLTVRHYGLAPMAMVTQIRMRRAQVMLLSTDYTLDQIASTIGYETAFAFSRAFKHHSGVSPKAFRARD